MDMSIHITYHIAGNFRMVQHFRVFVDTVKQHFYALDKFIGIRPLDNFMRSSSLYIETYGAIKIYVVYTNLCDRCLTCINKSHAEICGFMVVQLP